MLLADATRPSPSSPYPIPARFYLYLDAYLSTYSYRLIIINNIFIIIHYCCGSVPMIIIIPTTNNNKIIKTKQKLNVSQNQFIESEEEIIETVGNVLAFRFLLERFASRQAPDIRFQAILTAFQTLGKYWWFHRALLYMRSSHCRYSFVHSHRTKVWTTPFAVHLLRGARGRTGEPRAVSGELNPEQLTERFNETTRKLS